MKSTGTTGTNAVDWEARVDFDRLRDDRLARLKAELERSDMGAVLAFDFSNIRYMTATHIGTWAMDKLIRFSLLTRNSDPISWDFGSAAKHHQLYNPWLDVTTTEMDADPNAPHEGAKRPRLESGARAGISTLRGAFPPDAGHRRGAWPGRSSASSRSSGSPTSRSASTSSSCRSCSRCRRRASTVVDGQQVFMEARRIKTGDEIRLLTQAASMVDAAYEELYRFLRPGVRENEAVGLVAKTLYDLGSEYVEGVNAISGERCSPHPHVFSDRLIRPGDPAFFDILHSFNGYRTCYYRTFAVGSASSAQRDAYTRAREYMDRAIALVRPGATTADIVAVWPTAAGVRLPRRGGGVRPAVRPRRRACRSGRSRSSRGWSPSTTPKSSRRAWSSRWRRTGRRPTAGAPRASRRRSWSRQTGARSSRSSPPRSCSSPGSATTSVGGPLDLSATRSPT